MNLILLIIDTLRYDYVAANGNDQIHTPNLDALARRSWTFDRAFAASYPTIPHRTDVMTGRYGDPFHAWAPLRFDLTTLPRVLAEAGYCTQLIHDTPHLVNGGHAFDWPFHAWTFIRGAEVDRPRVDAAGLTYLDNWKRDPLFDFVGDPGLREVSDHTLVTYTRANRHRHAQRDWNAAQLFLTAAQWLRDNAGRHKFFLWLDCFDPHEPWDAPPEYVRMYDKTPGYDGRIDPRAFLGTGGKPRSQAVKNRLKAMYAAKVTWVDRWVGELLGALAETGLEEDTAVVVTADHGTNVGERGRFGKQSILHEQEAHVPLLIHVPGRGGGRSRAIVQPQDIFPTLLGIAGVDRPDGLDGEDVLSLAEAGGEAARPLALAGRAVHSWEHKPDSILFTAFGPEMYLLWAPRRRACRLFRYGSEDDLASERPEMAAKLWELAVDQLALRRADPALIEWLRAGGKGRFPRKCAVSPVPKGWDYYWSRLYNRW